MVAALQALQRLSASRFASAEALVAAPAAGRLFAAMSCGDDAVAAESARLLTRLWAPAVGRESPSEFGALQCSAKAKFRVLCHSGLRWC